MSWIPKFGHNLLNIIFLAKKNVEVFLKKAGQLLEIIIDKKVFSSDNIIENQYIIWLIEKSKFA